MEEMEKDFRRSAYLARIELKEEIAPSLQGRFEALVGRFNVLEEGQRLGELNLEGSEVDFFVEMDVNPLRADTPARSTAAEALLAEAPVAEDGFFVVPRILEE